MHSDRVGKGDVFNVAASKATSLMELMAILCGILNLDIEPEFDEPRSGDIRHSYASIDRAKKVLDYIPHYSLREGLEELLAYEESTASSSGSHGSD